MSFVTLLIKIVEKITVILQKGNAKLWKRKSSEFIPILQKPICLQGQCCFIEGGLL